MLRFAVAIGLAFVGCGFDAIGGQPTATDEGAGTETTETLGTTSPTGPSTTSPTDPSDTGDPTTASTFTTSASSDSDADTTVGVEDTTGDIGETTGGPPVEPSPSAGCGNSEIVPGSYPQIAVMVDGVPRQFDLQVPPDHDGTTPIPLVLAFHGWTLDSQIQAQMSDMSDVANARGFAVAYPQGVGDGSWNVGSCCGDAFAGQVDDVAFALALVENIGGEMCIDTNRIYSTGFSNGGMMSHLLGCVASDVFAAIGPVAGVIMIPDAECNPQRPMPVLHLHGTADTSVAYGGNGMVPHISVPGSTEDWVARNGCDPDPTIVFQQDDVSCERWGNCGNDGAEVVLCSIAGMGHCWPGDPACTGLMETPSVTIQASELLADFFEAHPMP